MTVAPDSRTERRDTRTQVQPVERAGRRWLGTGLVLCTVGWGANQFAPLLLLYRARLHLDAATVEATFGMYAVGLIPGLLIAGRMSDRVGRRPVVLTSVALSMLAGAILIAAPYGPAALFAGRLVMGVASGCAFSAGTAWIKELSAPPHDTAPVGAGARRAGVAMTLGFGLGPLVAGLLAQFAPLPTTLPYLPQLALAVAATALVLRAPETAPRRLARGTPAVPADRAPLLAVFRERHFRTVVLPLAPWVFGAAAVAMVFVPGLLAGRLAGTVVLYAALAAVTTALSGVAVQPLARRFDRPGRSDRFGRPGRPRLLVLGLSLVTAGMLAEAGAAALLVPALVLATAVVVGCGYGVCLVYGLAEVQRLAAPRELAGMTAVFQAFTYLGFAAPYLLSLGMRYAPAPVLLLGVAGLAVVTLVYTVRHARPRTGS